MAKKNTSKPPANSDLTTFRIRLGHTLRDLSKLTGLSAATLNRLERGLTQASAKTRVRLQDALGLPRQQVDLLIELSSDKNKAQHAHNAKRQKNNNNRK